MGTNNKDINGYVYKSYGSGIEGKNGIIATYFGTYEYGVTSRLTFYGNIIIEENTLDFISL